MDVFNTTDAIAKIKAGPQGPSIGAFFDFDGTLIDGYSVAEYFKERIRNRTISVKELVTGVTAPFKGIANEAEFTLLFKDLIAEWAGNSEEEVRALWQKLFIERIARHMFHEAYSLVQAHMRAGHTVAIASSATRYQIEPLATEYGIEHILATELEIKRGIVNGKLHGEPLWGKNKAAAVRRFAKTQKISLSKSYGYANGDEDIDFLSTVGLATAVNPQKELLLKASAEAWPVLTFDPRKRAPFKAFAGTVGAYSAMTATMLAGMAYNRFYKEPRRAADMVGTIGSELGLALAGIKVNILNEHNLWRVRPAVFILNHQSKLDFFIFYNIIRRELTGVVKKEAENVPVIGPFLRMAEMSFLDRSNSKKAIDALQPAVDRLKRGLSVAIAPEGTRSYTPKVGRFKKGAFHIAMQAGVPIVPVVIRNAGELMWREDATMRAGTVDICVLDPIDVSQWDPANLDDNIAAVRQLFVDTLADWPTETKTMNDSSLVN
ncbi:MAG: HAD-IB family hydrolase [Zhongshania sp.]|uniref:HAD-IB family hydrolase n=1 Tax=Zhongshania sp. TaxID=1971902 RepID=UPI002616F185|nr:HAD-IB family hydrolase [Zhongshania sp.]MDF1693241.1 HAD-IB family hydrolase [Zhongshania sp.]